MGGLQKQNKTNIHGRHGPLIKQDYFNGMKAPEISKKYGYMLHYVITYLKSKTTKTYIDTKGVRWRRCSVCIVYKTEDNYSHNHDKKKNRSYLASHCKICDNRRNKNKRIILENQGEGRQNIRKGREMWYKHKWRYNTRRNILRIIGYLDNSGKIIKKND